MINRMWVALLLLSASLADGRSFDEERHLQRRRLETLRRILPDGRQAETDLALVYRLADEAALERVTLSERPDEDLDATLDVGHVAIEMQAQASYLQIEHFFSLVAAHHRLADVVRLSLQSTPDLDVHLSTQLRLPYRPEDATLPAPPQGLEKALDGVPTAQAAAFRRDEALALAKSNSIAHLRRSQRNPRMFLAELAAVTRERPVVLTYAELEDDFLVRGHAVGEGPVRALEARFERGFFRIADFLMARRGACHIFEARGVSPVVGPDAELPLPTEDPFEQDPEACVVDRDLPGLRKLRAGKPNGAGALTLRLRDVDLADVFGILHEATGQGFVVSGDVRGRVSVDFQKIGLEEALDALAPTGIGVGAPGPIRLVRKSGGGAEALQPAAASSPSVSFKLKRADVRQLLTLMTEIDPLYASLGPQGALGEVSVWVSRGELDLVRAAVLAVTGLEERYAEDVRTIVRTSGPEEAFVPVETEAPAGRLVLTPHDLTLIEFELAGVAAWGDTWWALAYSPTGALFSYRVGDSFSDAIVKSVAATDVLLQSGDSPRRLFVRPLR